MKSDQSRPSGAIHDNNLLKLRLLNVSDTQKRIQRLFGLIYLLFLLVMLTWWNTNFESSQLEKDINRVEKALTIEMLKPWDNFLERTASCFHSYFFGYGKGGVVTQSDLKGYIRYYDSENRKRLGFIDVGLQKPWPVDKMTDLLDSEAHWQDCVFWARQDTLVSFLFSLHYYLNGYFHKRLRAFFDRRLEEFWAKTDSINATVDSILLSLGAYIDSLKKPFEYVVMVGWNPFQSGGLTEATLWGRALNFDEYPRFDLGNLLSKLQRVNHVCWFKKRFVKHKDVLFRVQNDLDSMLTITSTADSIRFSREQSDIRFYDLSTILQSGLLTLQDLPDSIQLPQLFNLAYTDLAIKNLDDALLDVYFPDYVQVLKEYNIDKVSGVKTLWNILVSQRGYAKQKIQLFGTEISSRSILYFLPIVIWAFYLLAFLSIKHLHTLLRPGNDKFGEQIKATDLLCEVLKTPLFFTIQQRWFLGLMAIPAVVTVLLLVDQITLGVRRGISLNSYVVGLIALIYLIVVIYLVRYTRSLHKVAEGTELNSREIPAEEKEFDTQRYDQDIDCSETD